MGTRADFYIGVGKEAEWLGSIAWDGNPESVAPGLHLDVVPDIASDADWRETVAAFLASRDDATLPDRGWPWPWDDSGTTDYTYTWTPDSPVLVSNYGSPYLPLKAALADDDNEWPGGPDEEFPDMSSRKNVRLDEGSGLIFIRTAD